MRFTRPRTITLKDHGLRILEQGAANDIEVHEEDQVHNLPVPLLQPPLSPLSLPVAVDSDWPGGRPAADGADVAQTVVWSAAEVTGRRIGAYEMYEEIARGGMAAVHLGRALGPDGPHAVAIKHLDSRLAQNPNFVAMFVNEGRMAARISHPNVVPPIDFVFRAAEGEIYLVMEYVHGESLAHLLTSSFRQMRGPSARVTVGIMAGVLQGLHAAHEATTQEGTPMGIVHRDVSPQNIMVGADGIARVVDFGVAEAATVQKLSEDRKLRFKPAYVAPEQIRGHEVDRRADIFSAGVVLWEMLAGRRLFAGVDRERVSAQILGGEIPPPSRFRAGIPAALDAVVLRALERDPGLRFATAGDFADAVTAAIQPADAREVGGWVQLIGGDQLARRAERVTRIVSGDRSRERLSPLPARPPGTASPAWPQMWKRRGAVGLLTAALVGVALWSTSGAAVPRTRSSVASALPQTTMPPKEVVAFAHEVEPSRATARTASGVTPASPGAEPATEQSATEQAATEDSATEENATEQAATEDSRAAVESFEPDAPAATETEEPPGAEPVPPPAPRPRLRRGRVARRAAAVADVAALNRRALQAYRRLDVGTAQKLLRTALATCAQTGLARHRITALTHAHLAVVLVGGFNQSQLGVEHFRRALRIDPMVPVSRRLTQPEAAAAFRQAVASMQPDA